MIEQLTLNGLLKNIEGRRPISSYPTGTSSPFDQLLNHELNSSKSLERVVLEYLIKTIESILAKTDQKDPLSSFTNFPLCLEGSFQPQPEMTGPTPDSVPSLSKDRQKGQEFDEIIQKAADQFGLEPALVKAVISIESRGNPQAVSPAGAQGLMQLMPKTAADLGVTDPFDPAQNIKAGTRYLSQLLDRYQGNLKLALAAYNWGMGNVEKNSQALPKETRNYIVQVEKQYQAYLNSSSNA